MRFERSGGEQESSRGHKFSILENVVLHRDFTSATLASFDVILLGRTCPKPCSYSHLAVRKNGVSHKTGLDQDVVDFVMSHPEAQELLKRYENFLQYALPLYVKEGKSQLTIAVGCTGGKHRSITFARKIAEYCTQLGYEPGVQHRDVKR